MSSALPKTLLEAIDWMAAQRSGSFEAHQQLAFEHWLAADLQHQEAWNLLQRKVQATFAGVDGVSGRMLIQERPVRRRALLRGALGLGALAAGSYCLTQPGWQFAGWRADLSTGTAQRQRLSLPDGSSLTLNARSAVNLDFDGARRDIELLEGGVIVEVRASGRDALRLRCGLGMASMAEGRCVMMRFAEQTQVWAQRGELHVTHLNGASLLLAQGQGVRLTANGIDPLDISASSAAAWSQGMLQAHELRLEAVIQALRPYRRGVLTASPEAGRLKISGVFSLERSDDALAAIAELLPLRVERVLGLWTRVTLA